MKIYTKTGDRGDTGLWGGVRVSKDATRVHAYGTIDECNSVLGMVRATRLDADLDVLLEEIQSQLFVIGADLASPNEQKGLTRISEAEVSALEHAIDVLEAELKPLENFILPGGTSVAAQLHLARTICRRAERWVVTLSHSEVLNPALLPYLNRLSDLLFVVARVANARAGVPDVAWQSPRQRAAE